MNKKTPQQTDAGSAFDPGVCVFRSILEDIERKRAEQNKKDEKRRTGPKRKPLPKEHPKEKEFKKTKQFKKAEKELIKELISRETIGGSHAGPRRMSSTDSHTNEHVPSSVLKKDELSQPATPRSSTPNHTLTVRSCLQRIEELEQILSQLQRLSKKQQDTIAMLQFQMGLL